MSWKAWMSLSRHWNSRQRSMRFGNNKTVQARLDEVADAHVDVLSSVSQLSVTLAELQEANSSEEIQEAPRQEGSEIMTNIMCEEGEIFALEQLLSEKRQLIEYLENEIQEQKQREQEQIGFYEGLMRESDEPSSPQQGAVGEPEEEIPSSIFEEIVHLWEKVIQE
ncbi:hypothetical protein BGW39_005714, partial [Mortierella sp. 14UC]